MLKKVKPALILIANDDIENYWQQYYTLCIYEVGYSNSVRQQMRSQVVAKSEISIRKY